MDMVDSPLGDVVLVEEVRQQTIQLRPLRERSIYTRLYLDLAKAELNHCSVNVADAFGLIWVGDRVKVLAAELLEGTGTEWSILAFSLIGDHQLFHAAVQEIRGGIHSGVILSTDERRGPMPKHRRFFAADGQLPCPPEKLTRGQVCLIRHNIRGNGFRDDGDNFFFLTQPGTPPINELVRRVVTIQRLVPVSQRLRLQLFKAYEDGSGGWEFLGRTDDEKIVCQIAPSILGLQTERVDALKTALDGESVVWVDACPRLPADAHKRDSIQLRATRLYGVDGKEEAKAETEEARVGTEEETVETTSEGWPGTAYERAETASMTSEPRDGLARTKSIAARARLSLSLPTPPPPMESATITAAQDAEIAARVAEAPGPWGALIPFLREFAADFGEPVYDIIALYQNPDAVMLKNAAKKGEDEGGWDEAEDELPFGCDYKQFTLLRERQSLSFH